MLMPVPARRTRTQGASTRSACTHKASSQVRTLQAMHCIATCGLRARRERAGRVDAGCERAKQGCAERPHTGRVRGRGGRLRAVVATMHVGPDNGAARTHRAHSMATHASAAQAHTLEALRARAAGAGIWRTRASDTLLACGRSIGSKATQWRQLWSSRKAGSRRVLGRMMWACRAGTLWASADRACARARMAASCCRSHQACRSGRWRCTHTSRTQHGDAC